MHDIYAPEEEKKPHRIRNRIIGLAVTLAVIGGAVLYFALSAVPKDLVVRDGETEIPGYKYNHSAALETVQMPETVVSIGEKAFFECANLRSVSMPSSLRTVGEQAFRGCVSLESLVIPESIEKVEKYALAGCTALSELTLPGDAQYDGLFDYKTFPSHLTVTGGSIREGFMDSVTGNERNKKNMYNALERVTIAGSITEIPERAFFSWWNLREAELSDAVTSVGKQAFADCTALEEIRMNAVEKIGESAFSWSGISTLEFLPGTLKEIGPEAFAQCSRLTSAVIPDSVTSIGDGAFTDCRSLESVSIPDSVEYIGENVFLNCGELRKKVKDIFPTDFRNAEDVREKTDPLVPEGARIVPMGEYEDENLMNHKAWAILDGKLYNLMPAELRSADWFTADYAIILGWHSVRNENVTVITTNSYGTSVNSASYAVYDIYLCGRDGSVRLIGSRSSADAESVWAEISDRF